MGRAGSPSHPRKGFGPFLQGRGTLTRGLLVLASAASVRFGQKRETTRQPVIQRKGRGHHVSDSVGSEATLGTAAGSPLERVRAAAGRARTDDEPVHGTPGRAKRSLLPGVAPR